MIDQFSNHIKHLNIEGQNSTLKPNSEMHKAKMGFA